VRQRRIYEFFIYIVANEWRTIYVGVTNNLERRIYEHKHRLVARFTARYDIDRLVYFEIYDDIRQAIARE
jgi:putative endonuclease